MSEQTKDGGPAFPVHGGHHPDDDPRNQILGGGMSLRDWFAGMALAGIVSLPWQADERRTVREKAATAAYGIADAMLAARGK